LRQQCTGHCAIDEGLSRLQIACRVKVCKACGDDSLERRTIAYLQSSVDLLDEGPHFHFVLCGLAGLRDLV